MTDWKSSHISNDGVSVTIDRTPTDYTGKAIIAKIKGSYSNYSLANRRMINLLNESNAATGEIVKYGNESYLLTVVRPEIVSGASISLIAQALLCNATLTVTSETPTYDDNGNPTGVSASTILDAVPCSATVITARMRQEDPGLLANALLKVYAQNSDAIALLDKATIGGNNYRVDHIDRLEVPGAMVLQLTAWTGA